MILYVLFLVRLVVFIEIFDYLALFILRVIDWRGVVLGCHVYAGWEVVVVVIDVCVDE